MWHTDFIHIFFSMFDNFPVPCTPGTYRDGSVTDCTECPQNTVSEEEGARTCTSCFFFFKILRVPCGDEKTVYFYISFLILIMICNKVHFKALVPSSKFRTQTTTVN